jgi:hypothetical protein
MADRDYDGANRSIGMGSYAFDGHYSHRGPCIPNKVGAQQGRTLTR